jgi:hypothetical protein
MKYSYTKLSAYDCPYLYKKKYIEKIRIPMIRSALVGIKAHHIVQSINQNYKRKGTVDVEKTIEQHFKTEKDFEMYMECCEILKKFNIDRFPIKQCYRVEFPIQFSLGRSIIVSKLDRLDKKDENFRIVEYKTGKPWKELTLQDKMYSIGISKIFPNCQNIILSKYFIRYNRVINHIIDFSNFSLWGDEIENTIKDIESDKTFEPKEIWLCSRGCAFKESCGIDKKM